MKKLIALSTIAAVMAAASVYAQGTVTFANDSSTLVTCLPDAAAVYGIAGGAAVPKAPNPVLKASLYYTKTDGGAMTKLADGNWSGLAAGRFSGASQTIADVAPGSDAWFQVKVWEASTGVTSYEQALTAQVGGARGSIVGQSSVFKVTLGSITPAVLASGLTGFTVSVVPEPSALALGLLGLAGLFAIRRRN